MSHALRPRLVGALTALLFLAMAIYTWPLRPGIPCLQLTYSAAAFQSIVAQWGTDGLARFRGHFAIDFPFLVGYGWLGYLLATATSLFATLPRPAQSFLRWALPAAAATDALENLLHLYLSGGNPSSPTALYFAAGSVATVKWLLIAAFLAGTIFALAKRRCD